MEVILCDMTQSSQNYDDSDQSQGSVSEVMKLVHEELDGLLTQQEMINRRIRNLHHVVNGLRQFGQQPVLGNSADQQFATGELKQQRGRSLPALSLDRSSLEFVSLKRACRIALMEATNPASLEEIYLRIVRRGAFALAGLESAHAGIARALNVMTGDGEVCCLKRGGCTHWQRINPKNEVADSFEPERRVALSEEENDA